MTGSPFVFLVFALVYAGMILGEFPRLAVDRTGIVLLGAIALVASERGDFSGVDGPTLLLLFSFMVISAQFRLSGFYTRISAWIAALPLSPRGLLGMVILVSGGLSALLTNDVICLAMTGVLGEGCLRRGLSPLPYALALACAANIGSAAASRPLSTQICPARPDIKPPKIATGAAQVVRTRRTISSSAVRRTGPAGPGSESSRTASTPQAADPWPR